VIAKSSAGVDEGRLVVRSSLTDVAVSDGLDFGAVPVAITSELSSASTELDRSLAMNKGQEGDCVEYDMLHDVRVM